MASIAVLVMTDGRDGNLDRMLDSWADAIGHRLVTERWIHDDTGSPAHRDRTTPEGFRQIGEGPRRGFTHSMRHAWMRLRSESRASHVLHLEDDFLLLGTLEVDSMIEVLDEHPRLAQIGLLRQPWGARELAAGGLVEAESDQWTERYDIAGRHWLERPAWWTCNPSLHPASVMKLGWPRAKLSELAFRPTLAAAGLVGALWGSLSDPHRIEHIGDRRTQFGFGY